ncbi:hypothetical protein [Rhodococcus zopfii]|uniref:hypothetical protein n=1 Tax=Rhodococcus zopfii TaxID=43772 RepID=UPI003528464F
MATQHTEDYADTVYAVLKRELEDRVDDFDGDVGTLFDHGEPASAVYFGLLTAADEGVPVSRELIDMARPLFRTGEFRDGFDYAVEQLGRLTGQ